jgi:outer membrane protein assembly factor BamD (BamD/ComL family)
VVAPAPSATGGGAAALPHLEIPASSSAAAPSLVQAPPSPVIEPVSAAPPLGGVEQAARRSRAAPPSASALFARANETRREGSGVEAIALYRQLQRLYPRSPEAQVSHLSLANLLVADTRRGEQALPQFDAYLASGGALEEEALYGRAQVLEKLARDDAERAAWRRLLSRFPDSVYAAKARHRLETLP